MNKKSLLASLVIGLLALTQIPLTTALEQSTLEVEAYDTIAGYTTVARIEDALSNEDIEIKVTKPNGGEIIIETETDKKGTAKAEIDSYHLKLAGIYEISARYTDYNQEFGKTDSFKVYEDGVSLNKSTLSSNSVTAEASGYDAVQLTVTLKDRYGNPIKEHSVDIISSRNQDTVTPYNSNKTNEKGEVIFYAYSKEVGVSTYTAYDTTSSTILDERAKVAYFNPIQTLSEIGGDNLFTSILLASEVSTGEIDHFEIEDLAETVTINELLNFAVTAYDVNENIIEDYMGTVRFSSSDDNADVPEDYTFEAEDQGTHTFSLSLRFTTTGNQTVTVTDINDRDIEGEITTSVSTSGSGASSTSSTSSSSDSDVTIDKPQAGTYSSTDVTVSGKTPYGYYVDLYDNGVISDTVFTDPDDTYEFTKTLANGEHALHIVTRDAEGNQYKKSSTITITIDTESAGLDYIELNQTEDIETGDTFEITIYSEPDLHQVGILLDNKIYELTEDISTAGKYIGILVAPDLGGEYSLDVILVDSLANEIQYSDAMTITVMGKETTIEEPTVVEEPVVEEPVIIEEIITPSTVTGVEAINQDGRVTLTWEPATSGSDDSFVQNYKIYYGPDPDLLFSTATTYDSSTTWYVPNLTNDQTYYFAIVAADSKGNESTARSATIMGLPKAETSTVELHDSANEPEINLEEIEETPESGPEIAWILLFTLTFSQVYFSVKKRIC